MMEHLVAITIAVTLDYIIGDPRWLPHPVRGIGMLISFLEKRLNQGGNRKLKGVMAVFTVCIMVYTVSLVISYVSHHISTILGVLVESIIIFTTIATKSLKDAAHEVYTPLEQGNLHSARHELSMIVGRDTDKLDEKEIVRGCVETVAENTNDGITAPLFYALFGGAPFAMVYRAVNTCDAMLGYKNERFLHFGWASARLDDLLNYLPARLTAFVMILANAKTFNCSLRECVQILLRDARKHPSPNSGWGEAAMAVLLGVQLGGQNTYKGVVSMRPKLGEPRVRLAAVHIHGAVKVMLRTVAAFVALLLIGGTLIAFTFSWG